VNRILPLLTVAVLLLAGGFYLAGERAQVATAAAAEPSAPKSDAETPPAPGAEATVDLVEARPGEPPVPEGYEVLPPFSEERRITFERAEQQLEAGVDYAALIETNRGPLLIDLYQDETPITVNSFVFLARHRYFDGIVFHRVLDGFMAQTGDPTGTGTGGPGYQFDDEIVPALRHDAAGVVSMANAGRGTNGSQFFITFAPTTWLDGAHTVFGRVVDGLETLDDLTRVDPTSPSAAVLLSDDIDELRQAGIDLPGEGTVGEIIERELGITPEPGQRFEIDGYRGVIGTIAGAPAAGFFPFPDQMDRVTILTRPKEQ
jgi:cyclophilin family peptidyl-prolyl cis-trans isomerase